MRIPDALASLADYGIIDEVLRPLMSGKEAQVYLVRSDGEQRVAKVYKEAQNRTFKNRADYIEGRKVRNTRDQRAMGKGSRHGRAQTEAAWRTTEVDMIYRLRDAGVRVPTPYHFVDGVLIMEMITDEHGEPAPRLGDVMLDLERAQVVFERLLAEVVRMLAAGVVHGDLSDFNVLMGPDGPVVIDFPQAVDASSNQNARRLLLRDVDNLHRYMARIAPERRALPYAQEMWALYERGELTPDTKLTGRFQGAERKVDTEAVLGLIGDAARDERRRREHLGLSMRGASDAEAPETPARPPSRYAQKREEKIAARKLEAARAPEPQRNPVTVSAAPQRALHGSFAAKGVPQRAPHPKPGHAKPQHSKPDHAKPQHPRLDHAKPQQPKLDHTKPQQPRLDHTKPQQPRLDPAKPQHPRLDHAKPQHPQLDHAKSQRAGTNVSAGDAAPKRRRRRRKRKPGAGVQSAPPH